MSNFLSSLSSHDSRHNLCSKCFIVVIFVNGEWRHNREGYIADHVATPCGKIFGGCRELPPFKEIITDPFLTPEPSGVQGKERGL
jgi:hypothetical protein